MTALTEPFRPLISLLAVMIPIWIVTLVLIFRRGSSPGRLAELYPATAPAPGTRRTLERAVFGRGYLSMAWVRIGADHSRLHVQILNSIQGRGAFSVPHEEVTATPDRYGWMILTPEVVRLSFARAPELVFLLWRRQFEALAEASGGRLRIVPAAAPGAPPPATDLAARR